jgi:transcription initiation factor TFIIIB Brf1 subunit/transcription initiation factor TFIIB
LCNENQKLVTDTESGEIICNKCGMVISDKMEEISKPEWRHNFNDRDGINKNKRNRTGNPDIINKKGKIVKLLEIQAKAYWMNLGSDYDYIRHAWILEAIREIKIARKVGIDLINFHANVRLRQ